MAARGRDSTVPPTPAPKRFPPRLQVRIILLLIALKADTPLPHRPSPTRTISPTNSTTCLLSCTGVRTLMHRLSTSKTRKSIHLPQSRHHFQPILCATQTHVCKLNARTITSSRH